jgi:amino acid permease
MRIADAGKGFPDSDGKGDRGSIEIKETEIPLSPLAMRSNFLARNMRGMKDGSLRGATLSMVASAIGSGVLAMAFVCKKSGYLIGMSLISFGGAGCYWSLYMMVQRARHHGLTNYLQICDKAGGKALKNLLNFSVLTYMFATCLACQIVITQMCVVIANFFGLSKEETGPV